MLARVRRPRDTSLQFEAPNVVAEIGPIDDTDFSQIHEVTVDRCAIETLPADRIEKLRVATWPSRFVQMLKYGNAGCRAAESHRPQERLDLVHVRARASLRLRSFCHARS
jgi:hypothetical protein